MSKFFQLLLDLQRLAQFDTTDDFQHSNTVALFAEKAKSDEQFYRLFDFTPAMIQFTEAKYHDARH